MSSNTDYYKNILSSLETNKPASYTSQYQSTIDNLMDKISNRESFSYDFNADPLYQQYKDNYTQLGNQAAANTMANAATLTGGYGNSYAATAATQANQQYLSQLNNVIPDLYNAALDKYNAETENLYNQYSMYGDAEDRAYGQYRDTVSDYYNDLDYYSGRYDSALSADEWAAELAEEQRQYNTTLAENQRQYDSTLAENIRQYNETMAYNKSKKASSSSSSSTTTSGNDDAADTETTKKYIEFPDYAKDTKTASKASTSGMDSINSIFAKYASENGGNPEKGLAAAVSNGEISELQAMAILKNLGY